MPFSATGSVVSTDLDNMLRGLYRDNSDSAVTPASTILKEVAIGANILGSTGGFHIIASGTITGTAGTKQIQLRYSVVGVSSGTMLTINQAAGTTSDWFIDAWCFNTATNAQRWFIQRNTNDLLTSTFDYDVGTIDTTQTTSLRVTGSLGNNADTLTVTKMDVHLAHIT